MADIHTDANVLGSLSESFDELSKSIRASAAQKEDMVAAMSSFWDDEKAKGFQSRTTNHLQELNDVARAFAEISELLANQERLAHRYLEDDY